MAMAARMTSSILSRPKDLAKEKILASVRTLYFPEIWYILENYFQLAKVKRALVVGYGLGLEAEALAKQGWDVTVVDPSLKALADLKERFAKGSLSASWEQTEADTLPFPTAAFEHVVSINMLEFMPNPNDALREMARVLTPGGKLVVATFNKLSPWGLPAVARVLRKDDLKRTARFLSKDEFARLFKNNKLSLGTLLERAAYMPGMTRVSKLKLPVAGAYVALAMKLEAKSPAPKDPGAGTKAPPDRVADTRPKTSS